MIAALRGQLFSKGADRAVVDVAGVGYEVMLATTTIANLPETGGDVFLHIHMSVREDAIVLYGFLQEAEKETFLALTSVSGIGPKLALGMLSGMRVDDLCQAIGCGDSGLLVKLPGIGKKTAERICVDLKDRIGSLVSGGVVESAAPPTVVQPAGTVEHDALSALVNLGYPEQVAKGVIQTVRDIIDPEEFAELRVEELIRKALRGLA